MYGRWVLAKLNPAQFIFNVRNAPTFILRRGGIDCF